MKPRADSAFRQFVRERVPDGVRKPLGRAASRFFQVVLEPLLGCWFDVFIRVYRTEGCVFKIPRDLTSRQFRASFLLDVYEAEERELIGRFVRPGDRVLEYGACLGVVSCTTAKRIGESAKHVVVEGNPLLISTIARNRVRNGASFVIENGAASASADYVDFHIHPVYVVGGSTRNVGLVRFRVAGLPLGELHRRHGSFDVLILDIEGAELELLTAGVSDLAGYRVVILELHRFAYGDDGLARCREILAGAGFAWQATAGDTEAWVRSP